MALTLDGSTYLGDASSPVVDNYPFTVAIMFNTTTVAGAEALWSIQLDTNNFFQFWCNAGSDIKFRAKKFLQNDVVTTAGYSADTWYHACAVAAASNNRSIYLDGGNKGNTTNSKLTSNCTDMHCGATWNGGSDFTGQLAHLAIWDVALTDVEIALLGTAPRVSPLLIRPGSLVSYTPLAYDGRYNDLLQAQTWGEIGSGHSDGTSEPMLLYPRSPLVGNHKLTIAVPDISTWEHVYEIERKRQEKLGAF